MNEASRKFKRKISTDTSSVTSSLASASGPIRCASPVGRTLDLFGREAVPASRSARPESRKVEATLGISGRIGRGSSGSAALSASLVNRLKARLDTDGSILFRMTWRRLITPSGRFVFRLRALARSTSVSDCTSWPTPQTHDDRKRGNTEADCHYFPHDLSNASELAAWQTPNCDDLNNATRASGSFQSLTRTASWATPRTEDGESAGAHGAKADGLHSQSKTAGWNTPATRDYKGANSKEHVTETGTGQKHMGQLANQVAHSVGISALTESSGPFLLNPRFSLWLQGLPDEWASCGELATQSMRAKRKRSSKPFSRCSE